MLNLYNGTVFCAADFCKKGLSDSSVINDCFEFAKPFDKKTIVFDTKDWHIDQAIEVPENTCVIVDGVTIKQKNNTFDNIFRSQNFVIDEKNPNGYPLSINPVENIRITGKNGAKLVGPDQHPNMFHPNQKTEQEMVGDYWGWRGFQICFSRVKNFEISGFAFEKQRGWAVSFDRCSFGYIHDLSFNSTVKNGDGVNIRQGCHDIRIENISGITSDDMVAINSGGGLRTYPHNQYVFPLIPSGYLIAEGEDIRDRDIYNVFVSNIHSKTVLYSHAVALLSRNGHKIYNVYIDGVYDDNPVSESDRLAMVGSYKGYSSSEYEPGDMHTIRLNNIVSNSAKHAIVFNDIVEDVVINKVTQNRKDGVVLDAVDQNGISLIHD